MSTAMTFLLASLCLPIFASSISAASAAGSDRNFTNNLSVDLQNDTVIIDETESGKSEEFTRLHHPTKSGANSESQKHALPNFDYASGIPTTDAVGRSADAAPDAFESRSYSPYASGSGGSGSYNSGTMMYYSNFDTALTTLAFLSFGVFLLNMIFSFLDFGTPLGPVNREDVGGKDADGIIKLDRRSTGAGYTPTMSPAALLALSAIQQTLLENNNKDDNNNNNNNGNQEVNTNDYAYESRPECAFRIFCDAVKQPALRERMDGMFSSLTSFILTGKLRTNKKLWETAKLHQLLVMMENGGCDELIRMCSPE